MENEDEVERNKPLKEKSVLNRLFCFQITFYLHLEFFEYNASENESIMLLFLVSFERSSLERATETRYTWKVKTFRGSSKLHSAE